MTYTLSFPYHEEIAQKIGFNPSHLSLDALTKEAQRVWRYAYHYLGIRITHLAFNGKAGDLWASLYPGFSDMQLPSTPEISIYDYAKQHGVMSTQAFRMIAARYLRANGFEYCAVKHMWTRTPLVPRKAAQAPPNWKLPEGSFSFQWFCILNDIKLEKPYDYHRARNWLIKRGYKYNSDTSCWNKDSA